MSKQEKNIVKPALEYFYSFVEAHPDLFPFHDYKFINETISACKEIAKAEGLKREDYELGLAALLLSDMGLIDAEDKDVDNAVLINNFITANNLQEKEAKEIQYYIEFFRRNKIPQNHIEEVLRDAKDIHLGMPDALERMSLLRIELEKLKHIKYTDLQWEEFCKQYFITHSFYTRYAIRQHGASKNYYDLERRIDRLRADLYKEKRSHDSSSYSFNPFITTFPCAPQGAPNSVSIVFLLLMIL